MFLLLKHIWFQTYVYIHQSLKSLFSLFWIGNDTKSYTRHIWWICTKGEPHLICAYVHMLLKWINELNLYIPFITILIWTTQSQANSIHFHLFTSLLIGLYSKYKKVKILTSVILIINLLFASHWIRILN